ncbi:MAG: restriction endonuclease subunit S [Anaerolineales bacterium]
MSEINGFPDSWERVPIREIAKINFRDPKIRDLEDNLNVSFLPMSAVDAKDGIITDRHTRLLGKVRKGYTPFTERDVLFAKITPCMENGKAAIATGLENGLGFGSTEFHTFHIIENVLPEWIYHYIRQQSFRVAAKANFKGTAGQLRVPKKFLEDYLLPLPPLSEQERIIKKIEELFTQLDAGLAELQEAKAQLERYRQSLLKAAVTGELTREWREAHQDELEPAEKLLERILAERRAKWEEKEWAKLIEKARKKITQAERKAAGLPSKISDLNPIDWESIDKDVYQKYLPKDEKWKEKYPSVPSPESNGNFDIPINWTVTKIENLATNIQYGYTESASDEKIGPKFLRITDIQEGSVDWRSVPYCEIKEDDYRKYKLKRNDIVFARTGATTGKHFLISDPHDAVFASYLIRLQLNSLVDSKYISHFFLSPYYWSQILNVRKGSAQPGVNATLLSKLEIPLPPKEEQTRITQIADRKLSVADEIENEINYAIQYSERLRQSILKQAFEGKLV